MDAVGSLPGVPSVAGLSAFKDSGELFTRGEGDKLPSASLGIIPLYAHVQVACHLAFTCKLGNGLSGFHDWLIKHA